MKISVIIVSAGAGTRLGMGIPKQFLKLDNREILSYSLEIFNKIESINEIIIGTFDEPKIVEIIEKFDIKKVSYITEGGNTRQETTKNALMKCTGDIILVHDAARPFITEDLVEKVIEKAKETGAAILATKAIDTIKIAENNIINETPPRETIWLAQTPQAFKKELLYEAQKFDGTDEASQVENITHVHIVESTNENFKITTKEDFEYANFLMIKKNKEKAEKLEAEKFEKAANTSSIENDNTAKSRKITIYTDGACSGNPGPGGFGVVLIAGNLRKEISEGFQDTTNNRMELKAVITGLSMLKKPSKVNLFTDSRYIVDAVTKKWVYNWKSKGWKRSTGEKALNIDLWEELLPLLEKHEVAFNWVKGHAGNEENERCDELARKGASNPVNIDFKPQ